MHLGKDIENRTWGAKYRGPLLIHAGKGFSRDRWYDGLDWVRDNVGAHVGDRLSSEADLLGFGGIIGIVDVVDCVEASDSPWFERPSGFVFANPLPLPFLAYRGQLGIFKVPSGLVAIPLPAL